MERTRKSLTVKQLAALLKLKPRRIQQLSAEGMPKISRGRYDFQKAVLWYVCFLQDAIQKNKSMISEGKFAGVQTERARKLRADAELKEIELAEQRGQLVAIPDVVKVFVDLVHMTKARVLATPPRIASAVLGETSQIMIQAIVEKQLKEALNELADDGANYKVEPVRS